MENTRELRPSADKPVLLDIPESVHLAFKILTAQRRRTMRGLMIDGLTA